MIRGTRRPLLAVEQRVAIDSRRYHQILEAIGAV